MGQSCEQEAEGSCAREAVWEGTVLLLSLLITAFHRHVRDAHMQSHAGVRARTKTHSRVHEERQGRRPRGLKQSRVRRAA